MTPMGILASGCTKPEAGVIAASPTTAPVAIPKTDGLRCIQPNIIQVRAAAAPAMLVVTKALEASPPAVKALPALKPNHPNQSRLLPNTTMGMLFGSIVSRSLNPWREPSTRVSASADIPAFICTTEPPAKSRTPSLASQPPLPHTQWATGQ